MEKYKSDGSQTWDQGDGHVSAIYWRNEGLTYSLISGKNNNLEPLYDYQTLIEIANTIKYNFDKLNRYDNEIR